MYAFVKRILDSLLAIFLLVLLLPVYLVIGLIIWLQDGGPAIFKQKRIGRNGDEFLFYKFRSMPINTPNVESRETKKLQVTTFGKFIRRTNLDELPQFYNVLKGDMSFIGPRPPIPSQTELIELRRSNGALALQPGLTGWAQVNAYDGMPTDKKAAFDGEYARRISFFMDFLILLKTVVYFTKKPPTY
ncbi:sugar transferase [Algoriphagus sp. A40]|uniref:sugar transferase n=1 Tax=Algoriphagus sp. A40 TaxID=1945863 RepID=UPI0009841B83|nr:sugar transferase [Algoriphagus sp. A40]OOG74582.1 capsular biosynthesis protein [Algoriphagus sp. A40]